MKQSISLVLASVLCAHSLALLGPNVRGEESRMNPNSALTATSGQFLHSTPQGFVPNVGQVGAGIDFVLRDNGMTAYFTERGFVLWNGETSTVSRDGRTVELPIAPRWQLVGARSVKPVGGLALGHTVSFFRGNDPVKWHANVPAYGELSYPHIQEGVEMRMQQRASGFEYSFYVEPHARPDLRFRYDGIAALEKSGSGELIVRTAKGQFREKAPTAFQRIGGQRREVQSWFEVISSNEYCIGLGAYDRDHELVVDPVLDWSTSVGGSYSDQLNVVKIDPAGDLLVAGVSMSVNLPVTPGFAPFDTDAGQNFGSNPNAPEHTDVYIAKFSADGTQLRWAGYLAGEGASSESIGRNKTLAVDSAGDVYITTHTRSVDFPVLPVGTSTHQGGADASITKIKSDGSAILWSRLIGAAGEDYGYAVAVTGNYLYLSGITTSPNFPVTARSFGGMQDAFVARLDAASGTVAWASFLGGSNEERVSALVADATGVIVLGDTDSADFHAPDFPAPTGHDRTLGGTNDAFLTKFNSAGAILWSTYLGGSGAESSRLAPFPQFPLTWGLADMAVDSAGNIVAVGQTFSADFPNTAGRFQPARAGAADGFVAKLAPDGSQVLWATYLGGSDAHEVIDSVAVNPWDEILIGGGTLSLNFPTTPDALKRTMQADGFQDGFLAKIDSNGQQLLYSSYIGNNGWNDAILGLDYGFGKVAVCGWHFDTFFQITQGTFQQDCVNCANETFVMSFLDAYMAHDGFESGNYSGGTGWAGNWTASGDTSVLTSSAPHSGSRHVRLRGSTGYLQRTVNVPPGVVSLSLGLWSKIDSFEGSDQALVLAKSTGANFATVRTFNASQSDNKYHYYEIDLSSLLPASQIQIAFDAAMNASNDNWYLDDIRLNGMFGNIAPYSNAGIDQTINDADNSGFETVALNGSTSTDPDGTIASFEWKEGATILGSTANINPTLALGTHTITLTVTDNEGATGSDTVQITINPAPVTVFSDSFEVGEWNGLWTQDSQNDWFRSSQRATSGEWSAEVDGAASDAALTSVAINLQGRTSATISFDWLIESSLDNGEYLEFRVSNNGGTTWTQKAILRGNTDPEDAWRSVTVELSNITQLKLQFRGKMSGDEEDANLDNIRVIAH